MLGGAVVQGILFVTLFGVASGGAVLGGMLLGYAAYEWVHYSTHYRVARTRYGRYVRAWHLAHHHKSPRARFGVTSPFWDFVFGTYEAVPTGRERAMQRR
jgi:sterol desaturase/sphingolipid hydroxylase (fatty acid hydroxylase superfamily)